jgi:hypothetical protein
MYGNLLQHSTTATDRDIRSGDEYILCDAYFLLVTFI